MRVNISKNVHIDYKDNGIAIELIKYDGSIDRLVIPQDEEMDWSIDSLITALQKVKLYKESTQSEHIL